MEKKGLNDAITTVLFIVLVLISIAMIWYFVRPLIYSASHLSASGDCIELQIEPISCSYILRQSLPNSGMLSSFGTPNSPSPGAGDLYYVEAKRGAGSGPIAGMRYVFEDSKGKLYTFDWNGSDAYPPRVSPLPEPLDVVSNLFVDPSAFVPVRVSVAPLLADRKTYCQPSGGFVQCAPAIEYEVSVDLDNGDGIGRCDGGVDINDLLYFLIAHDQQLPAADIAPQPITDGVVNLDDLFSFLIGFQSGRGGECPF